MNSKNPYYHETVSRIPIESLKQEVKTEIRYLCLDCGQTVRDVDPDFDYMCERVWKHLHSFCKEWEMMYFDQALKNGMMDQYDKGQKITVKRLLLWLSCFESSLKNALFARNEAAQQPDPEDIEEFLQNGGRFPQIILFRLQNKPDYDGEAWTLAEIEKTDAFKLWSSNRSKNRVKLTEKIGNL